MNEFQRMMRRLIMVVALAALLPAAVSAAHADNGAPITIEPDGAAPLNDGPTNGTDDEDDPPIPPDALSEEFYVYVSAPGNGNVAGIAYADEDVLMQDTATGQWTKVFDGTNAGLPAAADIDALDYQNVNLHSMFYLSFDKPVAVPGLGTVDDSDVVLRSCFLGTCAWSLTFDGSAHGLTTAAEDIDGLDVLPAGNLLISTSGNFNVPKYGGGTLLGGDEDVINYLAAYNNYGMRLDGSTKGLAAGNDLRAFDFDRHFAPDRDWIFLSFEDAFTYSNSSLPGVAGQPDDIFVDEMPSGGSAGAPRVGTLWDAETAGFPRVDAIELIAK